MRRKDREMPREFAGEVLDKCGYASLATVGSDGFAYCVPVSIVRDGEWIYFHCAPEGRKIENLRYQPRVCISAVGETRIPENEFTTEYESAVVTGTAEEVINDEEKIHALRLLCLRYTPGNMAAFDEAIKRSLGRTSVWKVPMESVSGKRKKYDSSGKEMKFGRME
ncbi:pyridoxamine 5'-phosphate oxidase family protein [Breznakiella homolactica]|uniref:Pyridoxamine 5'-phosphate oxidase family protein n=1 Tax=Breznakiella homolactica TaxID=2798577 RepID=A0A7T8BBI2_9SPIR|nr:pyridoxamine 5'-phosphate oxidase family protein [Breznakiella homolactica]QQO10431.1 pyridoxamine 5'-phosphate oxidase family protein [Breznakiella homolactica]